MKFITFREQYQKCVSSGNCIKVHVDRGDEEILEGMFGERIVEHVQIFCVKYNTRCSSVVCYKTRLKGKFVEF